MYFRRNCMQRKCAFLFKQTRVIFRPCSSLRETTEANELSGKSGNNVISLVVYIRIGKNIIKRIILLPWIKIYSSLNANWEKVFRAPFSSLLHACPDRKPRNFMQQFLYDLRWTNQNRRFQYLGSSIPWWWWWWSTPQKCFLSHLILYCAIDEVSCYHTITIKCAYRLPKSPIVNELYYTHQQIVLRFKAQKKVWNMIVIISKIFQVYFTTCLFLAWSADR